MREFFKAVLLAVVLYGCNQLEEEIPSLEFVSLPDEWIQPQVEYVNDIVHVLYYKGDAIAGDLFYTQYDLVSGMFNESMQVNHQDSAAIAAGTIRGGQLAVGPNGTVHVLWNGSGVSAIEINDTLSNTPLLYSRMEPGKAFEKARNLIDQAWGLDGGSDIAVNKEGKVFVAWHGRGEQRGEIYRRVYVRSSVDNGSTFSEEKAVNDPNAGVCGCCGLHINTNSAGNALIAYRSATGGKSRDIRMVTMGAEEGLYEDRVIDKWELDACPMSSINSYALADEFLLTWEKEGKVFFMEKGKNSSKSFPQSQAKGAKHSKIIKSPDGHTLMCWTEGTGWKRGGNLAWELTSPEGEIIESGRKEGAIEVWDFPAIVFPGESRFLVFN